MARKRRPTRSDRRLQCEFLESRQLLAGITGASFWQNPDWSVDLNADGSISPIDAMLAVNAMNDGLGGQPRCSAVEAE